MKEIDVTTFKIMVRTGLVPVECKCDKCRAQCRTPCLGTPDDILKLIRAGYGPYLAPSEWIFGMVIGEMDHPIPMVQAVKTKDGCVFHKNGLCILHDKGLKPTEGRLSYHIENPNVPFERSLTYSVAREWMLMSNLPTMLEIAGEILLIHLMAD